MDTMSRDDEQCLTIDDVLKAERLWLFPNAGEAPASHEAHPSAPASTQAPSTRAGDAAEEMETGVVPEVPPAAPTAAEPLSALCLSGGGIRSATFCLGVLQGLAEHKLLRGFHYLSTVSGGGYIGCWLSSWIMRAGFETVMTQLATAGPDIEPRPVRRLRAYTNYLSPVWGLSTDFLALMAIFVRNLALHWCVMLPLMAAATILPRLQLAALKAEVCDGAAQMWLVIAAGLLVMTIAYFVADLPGDPPTDHDPKDRFIVACFLPLFVSAVIFSWIGVWQPSLLTRWGWPALGAFGAGAHFLAIVIGLAWRKGRGLQLRQRHRSNVALDAFFAFASGAVGGMLLYAFAHFAEQHRPEHDDQWALYATLSVPALLIIFWVGVTAYSGLANRITSEDDREWWARSAAWWLGAGMAWLLAAALVIYLPRWLLGLSWLQSASGPPAAGIGAALLGVITGAFGYWSKNGATIKQKAKGLIEVSGVRLLDLAAAVFVLALIVGTSYGVSCLLRVTDPALAATVHAKQTDIGELKTVWQPPKQAAGAAPVAFAPEAASAPLAVKASVAYGAVMVGASWGHLVAGLLLLSFVGVMASWVTGINTFSLHSMYGNRLARAYLGASNAERHPHWFIDFDPLDNPKLAKLTCAPPAQPAAAESIQRPERRLFPVVNVALNLVKASTDRLEWQQRKAASFTMTPLFCGSPTLGFAPTKRYGDDNGGVSVGRAMAISGAAASPNMGYHTSTLVAFVMTFFNIRLGWWMPNPKSRPVWSEREPRLGLEPLLAEAGAGTTADRDFVYLSDGGHFENLGLYEMVRRGCREIVVIDASCDPGFEFEDLHGAIRKVRIDFGIPITFDDPLPTPDQVKKTGRRIAFGTIAYNHVDQTAKAGRLVYVKPVLAGDEPLDIERYAAANNKPGKAFPHQTTADQFFDEAQFESYRMLGQHIVKREFGASGALSRAEYELAAKERLYKKAQAGGVAVPSPDHGTTPGDSPGNPPGGTAGRSWWSGVADGMQSLNQGALLATAVTLGGVVGVTGSVGLSAGSKVQLEPGTEIGLAKADRALFERGIPLTLPAAQTDALRAQIDRIVETGKQLAGASDKQTEATTGLSKAVTELAPSEERVAQLDRRLGELVSSLQAVAASASAAKGDTTIQTYLRTSQQTLVQTQLTLQELKTILATPRSDPAAAVVVEKMVEIKKALDGIEAKVQDSLPRRNIRGVAEGGTR